MPACRLFDLAYSFVVGSPRKMRASDPGIGAVELLPDAITAEVDVRQCRALGILGRLIVSKDTTMFKICSS